MWYLLACCTWDPYSGGLKTKGFSPKGNPLCMIKVTRRCLHGSDMWSKPLVFVSGPGAGSSLSLRNTSDGCISHRLGSSHEWPSCPWSVEWSPSHVALQLPEDTGRVSSTQTLFYQTWEIAMCGAIPCERNVAGLLLIQRVIMLRPLLQELDLSVSVVRPPFTPRVLEAFACQISTRSIPSLRSVVGLLSFRESSCWGLLLLREF